jgi:hypothetical protein
MPDAPLDSAYTAALWEHPALCVAIFGIQFLNKEGRQLYEKSGIEQEMFDALEQARAAGLLLNRPLMSPEGPLLMQYWRTYADLDRWARRQPHSRWWRWLMEHAGKGVGFYHEIYQAKAAEAIYEQGTRPVGPAMFSSLERTEGGEGHSRERQQRFLEAARTPSDPPGGG